MRTAVAVLLAVLVCGGLPVSARDGGAAGENLDSMSSARLRGLYRGSKDPYARLWIVDALYARARDRKDGAALEGLLAAAGDPNADVRRRAVGSLEVFRWLDASRGGGTWEPRVRHAQEIALRDRDPRVRASAQGLEPSLRGKGGGPGAGAAPAGEWRGAMLKRAVPPFLAWGICFHLLGYAWQALGLSLLRRSGRPGRNVLEALRALLENRRFLLFPALATSAFFVFVGIDAGHAMLDAAAPTGAAAWGWASRAGFALKLYACGGLACFLPTAILAAAAAEPSGRIPWGRAARRLPELAALGLFLLLVVLPGQALAAARRRGSRKASGPWERALGAGALTAGCLTAAAMILGRLGPLAAARRCARAVELDGNSDAAMLRRPARQPQFILMAAASPAFFSLSLAPAMALCGFSPAAAFGLWSIPDGMFAVGFGVWAGAMVSAASLIVLASAAAVEAGRLYRASEAKA